MSTTRPWRRRLIWFGVMVATVVLAPFLLPLPPLAGTVPPRRLGRSGDRFIELSGVEVRFRMTGAGDQAFLLLHGFGSNVASWEPITRGLADIGMVVAFDRVGFGLTERPLEWTGESPYSGRHQVDTALALMDELGISDATLVGHSAGAGLALTLALDHPGRVAAVVLEAPSLQSSRNGLLRTLLATPQGQRVFRFVARRAVDRMDQLLESAYHDPYRITEEIRESYLLPSMARDWDRGLALFAAAPGLPIRMSRLPELDVPVLVITGDDDEWVDPKQTVALASAIPGAKLEVIGECGHLVHEECPAALLEVVQGWLRRQR